MKLTILEKESLLLALLAELVFVRVVNEEITSEPYSTSVVEEPNKAPWSGCELDLKPAKEFSEVVRAQGSKKIAFADIAGSGAGAADEIALKELLKAAN